MRMLSAASVAVTVPNCSVSCSVACNGARLGHADPKDALALGDSVAITCRLRGDKAHCFYPARRALRFGTGGLMLAQIEPRGLRGRGCRSSIGLRRQRIGQSFLRAKE